MIKTILWDVDGTLLDFGAAERAAILSLYRDFGLGTCTEDALRRYSQLNKTYWERLERREITKPELLVRRFQIDQDLQGPVHRLNRFRHPARRLSAWISLRFPFNYTSGGVSRCSAG